MCNITGPSYLYDNDTTSCMKQNPTTEGEITFLSQTQHCTDAKNKVFLDVTIGTGERCAEFKDMLVIGLNSTGCGNSTRLVPCDVDVSAGREPVCRVRCSCPQQSRSCDLYTVARKTEMFKICEITNTVHCFN